MLKETYDFTAVSRRLGRKDGPWYHRLVDELGKRDVSAKDTMVLLSVCRMTAIRYLNDIVTNGDGHICAWAKGSSGPYSPLYTRGGEDPSEPLATAGRTATREVVENWDQVTLQEGRADPRPSSHPPTCEATRPSLRQGSMTSGQPLWENTGGHPFHATLTAHFGNLGEVEFWP